MASYTPRQGVVLMRNPNYHGSRPHHFAQIELAVGISTQRAVAEIEAGTADYTALGLESSASTTITALASQLAARYGPGSAAAARGGQRYFVNPSLQLDYFDLNTHSQNERASNSRRSAPAPEKSPRPETSSQPANTASR